MEVEDVYKKWRDRRVVPFKRFTDDQVKSMTELKVKKWNIPAPDEMDKPLSRTGTYKQAYEEMCRENGLLSDGFDVVSEIVKERAALIDEEHEEAMTIMRMLSEKMRIRAMESQAELLRISGEISHVAVAAAAGVPVASDSVVLPPVRDADTITDWNWDAVRNIFASSLEIYDEVSSRVQVPDEVIPQGQLDQLTDALRTGNAGRIMETVNQVVSQAYGQMAVEAPRVLSPDEQPIISTSELVDDVLAALRLKTIRPLAEIAWKWGSLGGDDTFGNLGLQLWMPGNIGTQTEPGLMQPELIPVRQLEHKLIMLLAEVSITTVSAYFLTKIGFGMAEGHFEKMKYAQVELSNIDEIIGGVALFTGDGAWNAERAEWGMLSDSKAFEVMSSIDAIYEIISWLKLTAGPYVQETLTTLFNYFGDSYASAIDSAAAQIKEYKFRTAQIKELQEASAQSEDLAKLYAMVAKFSMMIKDQKLSNYELITMEQDLQNYTPTENAMTRNQTIELYTWFKDIQFVVHTFSKITPEQDMKNKAVAVCTKIQEVVNGFYGNDPASFPNPVTFK